MISHPLSHFTRSLNFSEARERPQTLKRWAKYGKFFILLAYLLFCAGLIFYFQAAHYSVELTFPRYMVPPNGVSFIPGPSNPLHSGGLWSDYFNVTTGTMIYHSLKSPPLGIGRNRWGYIYMISRVLSITNHVLTALMVVFGFAICTAFNIYDGKQAEQEDKLAAAKRPTVTLPPAIMAKLANSGLGNLKFLASVPPMIAREELVGVAGLAAEERLLVISSLGKYSSGSEAELTVKA